MVIDIHKQLIIIIIIIPNNLCLNNIAKKVIPASRGATE